MTTSRTCLVLGAGVSCNYGFPTGRELMVELCQQLAGGSPAVTLLTNAGFDATEVAHFHRELSSAQSESVDRFVANRMEFERIGKFAIAAALIPKEQLAQLSPQPAPRIYEYIWHRIGRDLATLKRNRLSFVTFNYDRSLEYFLLGAIKSNFGLPDEECEALLSAKIPIAHMYGQLGPSGLVRSDRRLYKPIPTPEHLEVAARDIHLVRDGNTMTPNIEAAQKIIVPADQVILLGFGYDEWNVRRLGLQYRPQQNPTIGTAFDFTLAERALIERLFAEDRGIVLGQQGQNAFSFLRAHAQFLT